MEAAIKSRHKAKLGKVEAVVDFAFTVGTEESDAFASKQVKHATQLPRNKTLRSTIFVALELVFSVFVEIGGDGDGDGVTCVVDVGAGAGAGVGVRCSVLMLVLLLVLLLCLCWCGSRCCCWYSSCSWWYWWSRCSFFVVVDIGDGGVDIDDGGGGDHAFKVSFAKCCW